MVGTLIGSQILPISDEKDVSELKKKYIQKAKELGLEETEEFNKSFDKVKTLDSDKQRPKFLSYIEEIAQHFVEMAIADKPWNVLLKEIKKKAPEFGKF